MQQEPLEGDAAAERPGAQLRAAREAAGLSVDQVAQQLKLAPRQVKALEDENFGDLPGRTFSRGFVRNYARLLGLDPEAILQHLPDAALAPALGSPTLHSTGVMIAELPAGSRARRAGSLSRWLIPLVLIACIVGAAGYEWYRGGGIESLRAGRDARPAASAASAMATPAKSSTPLPNPLLADASHAADAPASDAATPTPAPSAVAPALPAAMPAALPTPAPDSPPPAPLAAGPVAAADAPIQLAYAGPSWTEIRDHNGQVLIARLVPSHGAETLNGVPPFDIIIGNAQAVTLTYRGQAVDLAPFTRGNVARFSLP
jgi:cytoskeleton protein RodZ